ncbi:helix-turn-helix domain-containing protein [Rhizobium sp. S152]|uniref:helix-turn-helix domain-containing protein n=1 Tax=Rhizobium sp. S152 TaxID=3055038 RepID=UPI0025A9B139|nr:helix-turn-helix domain-containing protein [Rhizobium sp. S152]MDM9624936.1 helix-turn-helix domain-containing protein [Rhizobium sp. S152]
MRESGAAGKWVGSPRDFLIEQHVADTMTSAHWHDHIEINLLLEGSMTYLFNGRQEYVEAGRLVLFWAAIPHQTISVTPESPLVCIYLPLVDFLAMPIEATARQAILQGAFIHEPNPSGETMGARWIEEWSHGDQVRRQLVNDEIGLRVRRLILDHADVGFNRREATALAGPSVRYTQTLTDLISTRYPEALTLTSIAKLARVHPTTANRSFRDVLGISVMEYLTRFRLARAMQRLAETDDAILEIAHDCGFGSSARFYDIFKKRTETTPRQFRLMTRSR